MKMAKQNTGLTPATEGEQAFKKEMTLRGALTEAENELEDVLKRKYKSKGNKRANLHNKALVLEDEIKSLKKQLGIKVGTDIASKQSIKNNNNLKTKKMAEAKKSTKKRSKVRTDEELLKGSDKERRYAFLRTAFNVEKGKGGNFAGSKLGKVKAPSSLFSGAGKKSSYYWEIDEKDPRYLEFEKLGKAAAKDMQDEKWTVAVGKAMDSFLAMQRAGGGSRVKTASRLQGKTF